MEIEKNGVDINIERHASCQEINTKPAGGKVAV